MSGVIVLTPMLLLLNNDGRLVKRLNNQNRFFPVTLVTTLLLLVSSAFELWFKQMLAQRGWLALSTPPVSLLKNSVLLLFIVPVHIVLLRSLYEGRVRGWFVWSLTAPLALISLLVTDLSQVRTLSALALIGALLQTYGSYVEQQKGMEVL
jgi:hypothetical protein